MTTEQSSVEEENILHGQETDVDDHSLPNRDSIMESVDEKQTETSPESTTKVSNSNQLHSKKETTDNSSNVQGIQVTNNESQAQEQTDRGGETPQTGETKEEMIGSLYDSTAENTNSHGSELTTVSPLQTTDATHPTHSTAVPLCLPSNRIWNPVTRKIEFDGAVHRSRRGHVKICNEGRNLLESVGDDLVIVVCITGPARTGKSFLLSQFHNDVNFELGHSMVSHTTGIWVALSPEKIKVGTETARLLLLDAEGLDAVCTSDDGGNDDWDRKLFSVCMLLSSYMIYNCQLTPRATDLDKLGVIAQFSESIYYNTQKASMEQVEEEFHRFAPHFLWLIRDARLAPTIDGNEFTWDEYMEKFVLTCKENDDNRNAVRKAIKRVFQSVHAYALPSPCSHEDDFANLSSQNNKITVKPLFLKGVQDIKNYILGDPKIKRNPGLDANGKSLSRMLEMYVSAVNKETGKLEIVTISDVVVQSQLKSSVSNAIKVYKQMLTDIGLPVENDELMHDHHKAVVEANLTFEKSTRRIHDHKRSASSKADLSKIIEQLYEELQERNNKESENHCLKEMENLQQKLVHCLKEDLQNYGCKEIEIEKKALLERYRANAKGPMAASVEADSKFHIQEIVSKYRDLSLQKAEEQAEELYEEATKLSGNLPSETFEIEACHKKAQKHCLESLSRKYDKCEDCERRRSSFCDKLQVLLKERLQLNCSKSHSYCENVAEEARLNHFDEAEASVLSHDFSFFEKAKAKVLDSYDQNARGPAKENVKKMCEIDLDGKLKVIETIVAKAALKNANESYKYEMLKIIEGGPYEDEKLRKRKDAVAEAVFNSFSNRCKGISERTYEENEECLKCFMESQDAIIFHENQIKSSKLCDELFEGMLKEYSLKVSELVSMLVDKCLIESFDFNSVIKKLKDSFLQQYLAESKGPMKKKRHEIFNQFLALKDGEIQQRVAVDALGRAIEKFNESVEDVFKSGACDTNDLETKLKVAVSTAEKIFDDRTKDFQELNVIHVKENLGNVMSIFKGNCFHRNEGMSFKHCESLVADIVKRHRDQWKADFLSIDVDNVRALDNIFATTKKDNIERYSSAAKGPSADRFKKKCIEEIDRQIEEFRARAANSNLNSLITQFRETVEVKIIQNMPFEDDQLQRLKNAEQQNLYSAFTKRCKHYDEINLERKEKMLKEAANDILLNLDPLNYQKSRKYCEELLKNIRKTMQQDCAALLRDCSDKLLDVSFNPMKKLQAIKEKCLTTFDERAKGPAQRSVRERCCDDIDKHFVVQKRSIISDALQKATNFYSARFDVIIDENFLNEEEVGEWKNNFSEDVQHKFNERCKYSDSETITEFQELLAKSIIKTDIEIDKRHTELSQRQCQNLSVELISRVQQSCHELVLHVKGQNIEHSTNISTLIGNIRDGHLAEYNQQAKGSEKNKVEETFRIKLDKELHDAMTNIAKYFLSKCLDMFKSNMDIVLNEGPQDETYLIGHCRELTLSTIMLFQSKCEGLDESSYSNDVETLRYYLGQATADFKKRNEHNSLAFCGALLKDLQHERKNYKRKSDYLAEYRSRAKGPMIEKALSNFMDPIDTHYNSWYGIFSKLNPFK